MKITIFSIFMMNLKISYILFVFYMINRIGKQFSKYKIVRYKKGVLATTHLFLENEKLYPRIQIIVSRLINIFLKTGSRNMMPINFRIIFVRSSKRLPQMRNFTPRHIFCTEDIIFTKRFFHPLLSFMWSKRSRGKYIFSAFYEMSGIGKIS